MMFLKVDLKRKLLAIALTMVMAISCLFGVLFIRVNAAEIAISDLVTVSGDAIVKGVPQQYVMKNDGDDGTLAGTSVGDTGLYIESTKADSAGYTVALNGIFTGSTGMMLAFPGEGFWNGQMRSVIITVSSLSDPNETFDILFEGEWGMNATVAYEWEGQTLYRSRSQYNGNNYDSTTGEEDQVWRYQKAEHFFYPAAGCYNTAGTTADPRRTASYLGLEMTEEGALNVIFMANTNWGAPYKKVIASFAEDPATYEPITDALEGETPNLPRLDSFKDGYTISFAVSDQATDKTIDMLIASIASGGERDAYTNGTTYTLNAETLSEAPAFYENWQNMEYIFIEDTSALEGTYVGQVLTLPEAKLIKAGTASAFDGTITVEDSQGSTIVADGTYTIRNKGLHTVTYSKGDAVVELTFTANDSYSLSNVLQDVTGANVSYAPDAEGYQGITVGADLTAPAAYSGKIAGMFLDQAAIEFVFPFGNADGEGNVFTFTVCDLAGNPVFDIVYQGISWSQSVTYIRYGNEIRSFSYSAYDSSDDSWVNATYFYQIPGSEQQFVQPNLNNYMGCMIDTDGDGTYDTHKTGTLYMYWEGDVFCVDITGRSNERYNIAKFDGSVKPTTEQIGTDGYIFAEKEAGGAFGLPKLFDSLGDGYTISFSYNGLKTVPVTFISVNGLSFAGKEYVTVAPETVGFVDILADEAYVDGDDIYVAQNNSVGDVRIRYAQVFAGVYSAYTGSWGFVSDVVHESFGKYSSTDTVGDKIVVIPLGNGGEKQFNLHVETPYTLSFESNGGTVDGQAPAPIVWSQNTRFLLEVPEIERVFWEFDGWYSDETFTNKWTSFDGFAEKDATLFAKWIDVTRPTVALDGIPSYTEVLLNQSFEISVNDVLAQDNAQENITLKVEYRMGGSGAYTVLAGENVMISADTAGTWEIRYTVDDGVTDPVTLTRTVKVIEREPPVVTVTPVESGYVGLPVNVSGATAVDADGKTLDVTITVTDDNGKVYALTNGSFTPDKAGVYTVTCTAKDGDLIGSAIYKLTVIADTEQPIIRVDFADQTVDLGATVTVPNASATDNAYSDVTVTVKVTYGTEEVALQNGTFVAEKEGVYTVTYTATDGAGNVATKTVQISVAPKDGAGGGCNGCNGVAFTAFGAGAVVLLAAFTLGAALLRRKEK